jgi:cAMP-dependent protein kinase regulator
LPEAKDLASKKPRASVSAEAFGAWNQRKKFEAKTYPKTKEQELAIREKLENAFMFKNLDASEKEIVIAAMEEKVTEPKEVVIKEGDEGDCLFVVSQGTLQC